MNEKIEKLVAEYKPAIETIQKLRKNKIVLISGISGAGKDALKKELLKTKQFRNLVSYTTRPPRVNNGMPEINGVDYHFITEDEAIKMIEDKKFIEVKNVHGTLYGSAVSELNLALAKNLIPLTDVDIQGVKEYMDLGANIIPLFLIPPSYEIWINRFKNRYQNISEFNQIWQKRKISAINELRYALNEDYFYWIINNDLNIALGDALKIIKFRFNNNSSSHKLVAEHILKKIETDNN